jgi:hypothetical protein
VTAARRDLFWVGWMDLVDLWRLVGGIYSKGMGINWTRLCKRVVARLIDSSSSSDGNGRCDFGMQINRR